LKNCVDGFFPKLHFLTYKKKNILAKRDKKFIFLFFPILNYLNFNDENNLKFELCWAHFQIIILSIKNLKSLQNFLVKFFLFFLIFLVFTNCTLYLRTLFLFLVKSLRLTVQNSTVRNPTHETQSHSGSLVFQIKSLWLIDWWYRNCRKVLRNFEHQRLLTAKSKFYNHL
jgi:hypothetical protein